MHKTGVALFPAMAVALSAMAALTSCGSSGSSGVSDPPPVPQTKHVAVADTGDHRILIYDTPLSASSSATIAIGQAGFTEGKPNQGMTTPSAATLYSPQGIAVDSSGNLWVADRGNCRVVEFKAPFSTGMNASLEIGQPDFGTGGNLGEWGCPSAPSLTAASMESPVSIAFDTKGDLWVADEAAGRITEYAPPFSDGMTASLVIGQIDLQNAQPCNGAELGNHGPILPATAASLCRPEGIAFDSHGNLWVADQSNLRVLEFIPPFTTGMEASLVLGQPTATVFTGGAACDASASDFCAADALAFDSDGDLWVSDWEFNRVLMFVPPFTTGMAASLVIGQPDFTGSGPVPNGTNSPTGLAFDSSGKLIVVGGGSDIVVYAPPFSTVFHPETIISSGLGSCPPPGPTANTLCEPVGVATF